MKESRILCIPDLHLPYHKGNLIRTLKTFKKDYGPTMVVQMGDLVDQHTLGRWDPEPDAHGTCEELEISKEIITQLGEIFPKLTWIMGNHDLRAFKTMKRAGIPSEFHRSMAEIYNIPKGWHQTHSFVNEGILYMHGDGFSGQNGAMKAAIKNRKSVVMGHVHAWGGITWSATTSSIIFAANCGALIDDSALAFEYARERPDRCTPGLVTVTNKIPAFIPVF